MRARLAAVSRTTQTSAARVPSPQAAAASCSSSATFLVLDRAGNVPAFAPRHIASFWGTTPLGYGFSLGAGLRYVSEQFVAPDNRNHIASYALCEGAVFYARGRARVGVHLRNLTGTKYATRGFGSDSAIPGRPFEAMARFELGFGRP